MGSAANEEIKEQLTMNNEQYFAMEEEIFNMIIGVNRHLSDTFLLFICEAPHAADVRGY